MQRKPHLLPHDTWDKCQAPYDPELDKQKKKKNMDDTELKRINLFDHNAKKTPLFFVRQSHWMIHFIFTDKKNDKYTYHKARGLLKEL